MPLLIEQFATSFFFWLFLFLGVGVLLSVFVVANRRHIKGAFGNHPIRPHHVASAPQSRGSELTQKLGEKVVKYMIEVARSTQRPHLKDRIQKIEKECVRLMAKPIPEENKKIISTVLLWSRRFDVDRHITDMTVFNYSNQIAYDARNRDFKLKITGE